MTRVIDPAGDGTPDREAPLSSATSQSTRTPSWKTLNPFFAGEEDAEYLPAAMVSRLDWTLCRLTPSLVRRIGLWELIEGDGLPMTWLRRQLNRP